MKKTFTILIVACFACLTSCSLLSTKSLTDFNSALTWKEVYDNSFNKSYDVAIKNVSKKTITSVELTMHSNHWKYPKEKRVFKLEISPLRKEVISIGFYVAEPTRFEITKIRFSDGSIIDK